MGDNSRPCGPRCREGAAPSGLPGRSCRCRSGRQWPRRLVCRSAPAGPPPAVPGSTRRMLSAGPGSGGHTPPGRPASGGRADSPDGGTPPASPPYRAGAAPPPRSGIPPGPPPSRGAPPPSEAADPPGAAQPASNPPSPTNERGTNRSRSAPAAGPPGLREGRCTPPAAAGGHLPVPPLHGLDRTYSDRPAWRSPGAPSADSGPGAPAGPFEIPHASLQPPAAVVLRIGHPTRL